MAFAPPLALELGFSGLESILITSFGGILGVLEFYFLGRIIKHAWQNLKLKFFHTNAPPKRFTRMNRFIVWVRKKAGLLGLVLITPTIISIPIGTIIIHHLYPRNKWSLLYLFISVICWATVITPVWAWILKKSFF